MPNSNPVCQPPPDLNTCEGCFGDPGPSTLYWQQGTINEELTEDLQETISGLTAQDMNIPWSV